MQILRRMRSRDTSLIIWVSLCFCVTFLAERRCSADGEIEQASAEESTPHLLHPAIRVAKGCRAALQQVADYTAVFAQKERVGNRLFSHSMQIKHRQQPFSVYMKYIGQHKGREVIYVEGQNEGKLLAHDAGLGRVIGTIALAPGSNKAMSESIYPISDFGMLKLVDRVITEWESETKFGEVEVNYSRSVLVGKADCKMIETTHPQKRPHFRHHRTRLYIDKGTNFPVRVEHFGFPSEPGDDPPLAAEYQYSDIRVDQSLTDGDFDIANPAYSFK